MNILAAITKILVAGSAEYIEAEQAKEKIKDPKTGLITLQYQGADNTKLTILGTEHQNDIQNPEIIYLGELVKAIPADSKTVFILEGQYGNTQDLPEDPNEAIKVAGGEFGYMAALARQRGIEYIPGEPDPRTTAEQILRERPDISRGDIALHYALKTLAPLFRDEKKLPVEAVAPYIHHSVGIAGNTTVGGWVQHATSRDEVLAMNEKQKAEIIAVMPEIVRKLNTQFQTIQPETQLLDLQPDGTLHLLYDLSKVPVIWDPAPEILDQPVTVITEISRLDMLMRDRHTLHLIQQALDNGKEPIVAVGNSHVATLRPALDAVFHVA